ncbi:aromatic ring-hydroxylating oxygenase subunit alpha [Actinomarinicola tropica]|nr:SRPBCC family protein [Actinomarinicola tropica]
MVLLSGTGNAAAIRCPYHLWTYSWDGSLVAAPQTAGLDGFDRSEVCLPRLAVETWQGFVLVNTDLDAEPLAPQLVGLDERLAGLRIDEMVRVGAIEWDQPWNWKTTFENYAESYHHQGVHPDTLQPIFPGERSLPATGGDAPWLALDHESTVEGVEPILVLAVFPLLWPTVVRPDSMVWLRIEPHGPARSTLTTEVFVLPELADDEEVVAGHLEATRAVNAQDEVPNRGVAAGLASRYATTPVLHPLEAGIDHFTRWYLQRMGADA